MKGSSKVLYYGESGLVSGLVADVIAAGADRKLLECVAWNGKTPDFVKEVEYCEYLPEYRLGDFGSPDLVIVAHTSNAKFIVFVEAKVVSYANACASEASFRQARTINVQLALDRRFKQAVVSGGGDNIEICEEADYDSGIVRDRARSLRKGGFTSYCRKIFADADGFYYVALTTDPECESPYEDDDVLKALIGAAWEGEKGSFGILTWGELMEKGIVSRESGAFANAAKLMLPVDDTGANKLVYTSNPTNLRGVKLEEWSEDKKSLIDALTRLTPCLIGAVADETEIEELTGSYSYRVGNIVYARIMYLPTENTVVLALLKDENIPQFLYDDDKRFVCKLPNSDKQYIGYKFYTDADVARFREGLDEYFA